MSCQLSAPSRQQSVRVGQRRGASPQVRSLDAADVGP